MLKLHSTARNNNCEFYCCHNNTIFLLCLNVKKNLLFFNKILKSNFGLNFNAISHFSLKLQNFISIKEKSLGFLELAFKM